MSEKIKFTEMARRLVRRLKKVYSKDTGITPSLDLTVENLSIEQPDNKQQTTNTVTLDEAMQQFPFLKGLQLEYTTHIPLEVELSEMDDRFLNQSLMENESEALGHERVRKTLYFVNNDNSLRVVDVKRLSQKIYPPEYLHPGMDFQPDEYGFSETILQVLDREDLTKVQYVVLHRRGIHGGWYPRGPTPFNSLAIALVKGGLKK